MEELFTFGAAVWLPKFDDFDLISLRLQIALGINDSQAIDILDTEGLQILPRLRIFQINRCEH